MDTDHGIRSQERLLAVALTAFAALWLTAGEGTLNLVILLLLAQPVIWLARRPLQDLSWTFGLPVAATVGMLLAGGPGEAIAALLASPWTVLSALDFSVWVMTACALGVLSGLRVYQWTHARSQAYRRAHGLASVGGRELMPLTTTSRTAESGSHSESQHGREAGVRSEADRISQER